MCDVAHLSFALTIAIMAPSYDRPMQNTANAQQPVPVRTGERVLFGCLIAFAAATPHSIALTQAAFGAGLIVWMIVLIRHRCFPYRRMMLDLPIILFVGWSILAAVCSYEPAVSIGKLRSVSLFLIYFLVGQNLRRPEWAKHLVVVLIASSFLNVGFVYWEKITGRGMVIESLASDSPLRSIGMESGDVLLRAEGKTINSPEDLARVWEHRRGQRLRIFFFRPEVYLTREIIVPSGDSPPLGIQSYRRWRDFRAAGFYGWNYFTYAEVVQLVASLLLGIWLMRERRWDRWGFLSLGGVILLGGALLLTVTRAAWAGFALSAAAMVVVRLGRRGLLVVAAFLLVLAPVAFQLLERTRGISSIRVREPSTSYRLTVWREGLELLARQPRHWIVGVGMDSLKRRWREWGLFQGGRLPLGHFHSTPIQIAVERGLPALALFLWWFGLYLRLQWRLLTSSLREKDPVVGGIVLGTLGGTLGFLLSSLVHYNFGDSEVAMIVYFQMGLMEVFRRWSGGEGG